MKLIFVSLIAVCAISRAFAVPIDLEVVGPEVPVVSVPVDEISVLKPVDVPANAPLVPVIPEAVQHQFPTFVSVTNKPVVVPLVEDAEKPIDVIVNVPVSTEKPVVMLETVPSKEVVADVISMIPVVPVEVEEPVVSSVPVVSKEDESPLFSVMPVEESKVPVILKPDLPVDQSVVAVDPVPVKKPLVDEVPVDVTPEILPIPVKPESELVFSVPSLPVKEPVSEPISTVLAEKPTITVNPVSVVPQEPVVVVAPVASESPVAPVVIPSVPLVPVDADKPVILSTEPLPKPAVIEPVPKPSVADEDPMEVALEVAESQSFPTAVVSAPETESEDEPVKPLLPEDPFLITPGHEEIEPFPDIPGVPPIPDPNAIPVTSEGRFAGSLPTANPTAAIVKSYFIPLENGSIWGYTSEDGTQRQERIVSKYKTLPDGTTEQILVVDGRCQYYSPDGQLYYWWYRADDQGTRMINPTTQTQL